MTDRRTIFADRATAVLYDAAVRAGGEPGVLARQFVGIWQQLASAAETTVGKLDVPAEGMADLAKLAASGTINATAAAQIAQEMYVAIKMAARSGPPACAEHADKRPRAAAVASAPSAAAPHKVGDSRVACLFGRQATFAPRTDARHECRGSGGRASRRAGSAGASPSRRGSGDVALPPRPSPLEIARRLGLIQEREESALRAWVDEVFAAHPQAVRDALRPNPKKTKGPLSFLRGQVMKVSRGRADPRLAGELIERKRRDLQ